METVTDIANEKIALRQQADDHPLELAAESRAADEPEPRLLRRTQVG